MSTPSARPNRKTTVEKPLLSTSKTIEAHTSGTGTKTDVNSLATARKLLSVHGLSLLMAGNILQAISIAICEFSISANLGATHTDILRALAYLVHEVDEDIDTGNIIMKIQDLMGGPIAALEEKVDQLEDMTKKQKEEIEKVIGEVSEKLKESTEKLGKMVEKAETISTVQTQISQQTMHTQGSDGPKSYAAAAKSNIVFSLKKILAKNEAQARQIMIDR
jgi:hypothetical protein